MKDFLSKYKYLIIVSFLVFVIIVYSFVILITKFDLFILFLSLLALGLSVFLYLDILPELSNDSLTVISYSTGGSVTVTSAAIKNVIRDICKAYEELRYTSCTVENTREGLHITVGLKVRFANVFEATDLFKEFVKNFLETEIDAKVSKIDIIVKQTKHLIQLQQSSQSTDLTAETYKHKRETIVYGGNKDKQKIEQALSEQAGYIEKKPTQQQLPPPKVEQYSVPPATNTAKPTPVQTDKKVDTQPKTSDRLIDVKTVEPVKKPDQPNAVPTYSIDTSKQEHKPEVKQPEKPQAPKAEVKPAVEPVKAKTEPQKPNDKARTAFDFKAELERRRLERENLLKDTNSKGGKAAVQEPSPKPVQRTEPPKPTVAHAEPPKAPTEPSVQQPAKPIESAVQTVHAEPAKPIEPAVQVVKPATVSKDEPAKVQADAVKTETKNEADIIKAQNTNAENSKDEKQDNIADINFDMDFDDSL